MGYSVCFQEKDTCDLKLSRSAQYVASDRNRGTWFLIILLSRAYTGECIVVRTFREKGVDCLTKKGLT